MSVFYFPEGLQGKRMVQLIKNMYIRVEPTDWISQGLRNSSQDKKYIIYISAR